MNKLVYKVSSTLLEMMIVLAMLFLVNAKVQASSNGDSEFELAYNDGVSKGIINDTNLTKEDFLNLCKSSLFPAYLEFSKENSGVSFREFAALDNYEVPEDTAVGVNSRRAVLRAAVPVTGGSGYSMKAGDILICYGTNSLGKYVGHAAIATSANYVLEMTGPKYSFYAQHHTKTQFFKRCTGGSNYVLAYRIKNHPKYAAASSSYAYHHMYKGTNPFYSITTNLFDKSKSYCSKYVLMAYYYGATKNAVKTSYHSSNAVPNTIVLPHDLASHWFKSDFVPTKVAKVSSY